MSGFWDAAAPVYDVVMAPMERHWFAPIRRWLCAGATGDVLEVGIGTGRNLQYYPPDVRLTGIDKSAAMLARARAQAARLDRPADLAVGLAHHLDLPDDSFDTVVATLVLCEVPDVREAVNELVRVLRPGGRLLLADHVASSSARFRAVQHMADATTTRWSGEHWGRRPLDQVRARGLRVEQVRAVGGRLIEAVVARRE